jgi:hypothetical protein
MVVGWRVLAGLVVLLRAVGELVLAGLVPAVLH